MTTPDTAATPAEPKPIPDEVVTKIEDYWISRWKATYQQPKGAKYLREEAEFFAGACAAIAALHPEWTVNMRWYIAGIRGERIVPLERFAKPVDSTKTPKG